MSLLPRQAVVAALTANALHPVPGYYAGVATMVGGWLTGELAPHLAVLTAADAGREVLLAGRRGRDRTGSESAGLALAAANLAGLGYLVVQSQQAKGHVDRALLEALGPDYRDRLSRQDTDLDLSTPLAQLVWPLVWPFHVRDDEVEVVRDVAYAPEHGARGMLDIYRRRGREVRGAPVLLQVHGGAWTIGSKEGQGVPLMRHMAARGWVCVAANYRLAPRHPFPAQLVDVKRALAWIRSEGTSYGMDPRFVAITGGSAGGHLASLAALTPGQPEHQPGFEDADTSVQAAVPHYGVYDLAGASGTRKARKMRDSFLGPRILRKSPKQELAAFEAASPLLQVGPDAPPFLVIHGRHDSLVEVSQARQLVERLRAVSHRTVAYAELPGTQHAFDVFPSIRSAHVVRGVDRFLRFTYAAWREEQGR